MLICNTYDDDDEDNDNDYNNNDDDVDLWWIWYLSKCFCILQVSANVCSVRRVAISIRMMIRFI